MTTPTLLALREALEASWRPDTAYLGMSDPARRALGQCYPTARVLQHYLPVVEIAEGLVDTGAGIEKHFWAVAPTDAGPVHVDLTWQQFPHGSRVVEWHVRDRGSLGDSAPTQHRVALLLSRVETHLAQMPTRAGIG